MSAAPKTRIALLCLFGLAALWLLGFFSTEAMDSLPVPFSIEIDGKPVAKVADDAQDRSQAKLGSDAAVFHLKDSRLECGEWVLGRNVTEDRSLLPKKVSWYKASNDISKLVQPVKASKEGDSYLLDFASTCCAEVVAGFSRRDG